MATVEAFRRITAITPAHSDQEHLHVFVDSDPSIPDRTRALLHGGEDPRPKLLASGRRLIDAGAELICLPCNTSHAFYEWLQERIDVPIVHMVDEAATAARKRAKGSLCGLLATSGTAATGIYATALHHVGLEIALPGAEHQRAVHESISVIKAGGSLDDAAALCAESVDALLADGATMLILGCTELSLIADRLGHTAQVVDALQAMAEATVDIALGRRAAVSL
ncbi:aspartate racemase [Jiangella sp. DSM 45060]|nr:aspartate racemase [Jiangella sp. DSM 45060]